jgi:hypothetical protein
MKTAGSLMNDDSFAGRLQARILRRSETDARANATKIFGKDLQTEMEQGMNDTPTAPALVEEQNSGGNTITMMGTFLTPEQEEQVHRGIEHDIVNHLERRVEGTELHISSRRLAQDMKTAEVYVLPALTACDGFLVGYAEHGDERFDPPRRRIYLSPGRFERLMRSSGRARDQFWIHELFHLDFPEVSEEAVQKECPIQTLLVEFYAEDLLQFGQWSEQERKFLEGAAKGMSREDLATALKVTRTRVGLLESKIAKSVFLPTSHHGIASPGQLSESDMPLWKLNVRPGQYAPLRRVSIETVDELAQYSEWRLLGIKNFEEQHLIAVTEALKQLGRKFADHPGSVPERIRKLPITQNDWFYHRLRDWERDLLNGLTIKTFGELLDSQDKRVRSNPFFILWLSSLGLRRPGYPKVPARYSSSVGKRAA